MEKVALFVDGANLFMTLTKLGWQIDYKKFKKYISRYGHVVRSSYYTAIHRDSSGHERMRTLCDFLEHNGWMVQTKDAREYIDNQGKPRVKGNMDVELTVDVMMMHKSVDCVTLVTGDGDFCYLVNEIKKHGTIVRCVSAPPMLSDRLRRCADAIIDLRDIREQIEHK